MAKPTMDDVARRAGVSRALVSLALRDSGKVSASSRAAVMAAADELGYRPNLIARNLASKQTRTFGLLINDLHNPYFPGVADGVKRAADRRGYRLLLNSAFLDDDDERAALETFIDFRVDGIILTGARVAAGRRSSAPRPRRRSSSSAGRCDSDAIDTINNDDRLGATFAVEHLIGLGHRHIWHIDGGRGAGAAQRRAGLRGDDAQARTRTARAVGSVHRSRRARRPRSGRSGRAARSRPSSPATTSVRSARSTRSTRPGCKVPDDISLVGYDNTFVAALRHVALTTVDQARERLGELAIEALIERIE